MKINVYTHKFKFSHGKEPRGRGFWAFDIAGETVYSKGSMTYADAKKMAIEKAKAKGKTAIYVLP